MSDVPSWLEEAGDEVRVRLLVSPRASRTAFSGLLDDRLRLRVAAPPVDGAANAAVVKFMAGVLDVGSGAVRVVQGERGKRKVVGVTGLGATAVAAAIRGVMDAG